MDGKCSPIVAVSQQSWRHGNHDLRLFQPTIAEEVPARSLWLRRVVDAAQQQPPSFPPTRHRWCTSAASWFARRCEALSEDAALRLLDHRAPDAAQHQSSAPQIRGLSSRSLAWVPALRRTAKEALRRVRDTNQRSRGAMRPSFCNHLSLNVEGAGKAGCLLHPQPGVRKMKAHQPSHHRFNRVIPAFPARVVLTVSFVLSPETWLCCLRHRRDAKHRRQLDTCLGVSGPHDFAVRLKLIRLLS